MQQALLFRIHFSKFKAALKIEQLWKAACWSGATTSSFLIVSAESAREFWLHLFTKTVICLSSH